ncbi:MAG TPA: TlpA disulfide reductase family protein [Anaerolineales bacterium]|nr:TlpA disulfide reductase family protein [Anaerolineales bacterium]
MTAGNLSQGGEPFVSAASADSQARNRRAFGRPLAYGLVLGLLSLLAWGMARADRGPRDTGAAPDFSLTGFDGRTVTLSELRGQVVVINFWASWCPPCREEAAYLERTWRAYRDRGVVFIGVDWVDTEKEALAYIDEFDITYLNGPDIGTRIAQAYNIQGVPETFFVDKSGQLRGVHIGPLYPPELDERIDELLAEPSSGQW